MAERIRRVKGKEFLRQLADHIGLDDGYLAVELEDTSGKPTTAWVFLAIEDEQWQEIQPRLTAAETHREVALILLDGRKEATAQEQLDLFLANGFTEKDINTLFWSERQAALSRINTFRYDPRAAAKA